MSPIQTVALVGATGAVGAPALKALLAAGFTVTVLHRAGRTPNFPPAVRTAIIDYSDPASLVAALRNQDAVVSTIASASIALQKPLIDAAIAAGVRRFIPSEFGCDGTNPLAAKLPVYGPKQDVQTYLEARGAEAGMEWTAIYTNAFLDFGVAEGFLIDARGKALELLDGGLTPSTVTPLAVVADAIVRVLERPEGTRNRHLRVHGAALTQRRLLALVQGVVGSEGWTVSEVSSAEVEKEALKNFREAPGKPEGWVMGMLKRAIYGDGFGGDFSKNNDNELLGIKELTDEEVKAVVRASVPK